MATDLGERSGDGTLQAALEQLERFVAATLTNVRDAPAAGENGAGPRPFPNGLGELAVEVRDGPLSVRLELKDVAGAGLKGGPFSQPDHFIVPMTYVNNTANDVFVKLVHGPGADTITVPAHTHGIRDLGNANEAGTTQPNSG